MKGLRTAGFFAFAGVAAASAGCGLILGLGDPVDGGDAPAPSEDAGDADAAMLDASDAQPRAVDSGTDAGTDALPAADAADAAEEPPCDLTSPFGSPALVVGMDLNTSADEGTPRLAPDELTLYFWSNRAASDGGTRPHVYLATRNVASDPFGAPSFLSTVNSAADDASPTVSADGLTLLFESDRLDPPTTSEDALFIATRGSTAGAFLTPSLLQTNGWPANEKTPYLRPDARVLYFSGGSGVLGGQDIERAELESSGSFGAAAAVSEINSTADDYSPVVDALEQTIFWGSDRTDEPTLGGFDIFVATRASTSVAYGGIANAGASVNSTGLDLPGWISPDGCRLYFESDRAGSRDLYVAGRP